MVYGFVKSKEGEEQFKSIGRPYPNHVQDELYESWLAQTQGYSEDVAQYFSPHKGDKEVHRITRVKTGDGKEWITYQLMEYRLDSAANLTHRYRSTLGEYPIPRAHYKFNQMNFGKMERTVDEVVHIEKGYSIPFTMKNLQKIVDMGLEYEGKVQYILRLPNGLATTVRTYQDFENGVFEELAHFGRIPLEHERQKWLVEGGESLDKEMQDDFIRQRTEGDIQKRPVTADDVQKMIKQAESTSKSSKSNKNKEEEQED